MFSKLKDLKNLDCWFSSQFETLPETIKRCIRHCPNVKLLWTLADLGGAAPECTSWEDDFHAELITVSDRDKSVHYGAAWIQESGRM